VLDSQDNVAGVKLPVFERFDCEGDADGNLGLSGGGKQVDKAKQQFVKLLERLIRLASLQTSFLTLDEALKVRVLAHVGVAILALI
jgi:V-type H+-transporting ATPase subunit D